MDVALDDVLVLEMTGCVLAISERRISGSKYRAFRGRGRSELSSNGVDVIAFVCKNIVI
ncbi:hypothetical protein PP707_04895 [Acetobacter pasteurianus]|nr:hypothetical protein [Acetobacter pasteurianus]